MTPRSYTLITLLLIALWGPHASSADAQTPIHSYTVTTLGSLGGGGTTANAVDDAGNVVGLSYNAIQQPRAFLWQSGVMSDLGTLGGSSSSASGINNYGQVTGGAATAAGALRAFLWTGGVMYDLGTLGGLSSEGYGINDAGQVVGSSTLANNAERAFLWKAGIMVDLGTLPGGLGSTARGINSSGQVTGYAWDSTGSTRAFLWTPNVPNGTTGTMTALSSSSSQAHGLNTGGSVVGRAPDAYGYGSWPCLWDASGAYSIPVDSTAYHPSYGTGYAAEGSASGINTSRAVVGANLYSFDLGEWGYYTDNRAFIWDSVNGTRALDLLAEYGGWFDSARSINASGQVAANRPDGAFLLTPSPIPTRPQNLWAQAGDARVQLTWTAPISGVESYNVKRGPAGGPYEVIARGVTSATYTDTAVLNGSTYEYVVSAVNTWGESLDCSPARATPIPVPGAPGGLTATPGDQQVSLSWTASAGADYYYIYRATTSGGPYSYVAYTYDVAYVDYGDWDEWNSYPLQNGTTYYYVVRAVNGSGESPASNQASATPMPPPPPPAPTGLTATAGDTRVSLSWNASDRATEYRIKRASTSGGPYQEVGISYGYTNYTDNYLTNGTTYYYVVSAVNTGGASPDSSQVSATPTGPPPPVAPTNLAAATAGKRKVTLKWTQSASAGVTQNRVCRSTTSGGGYSLRATISAGTSFNDTGLTSGVTYYYVVTAVSSIGKESAYSNQASAKSR